MTGALGRRRQALRRGGQCLHGFCQNPGWHWRFGGVARSDTRSLRRGGRGRPVRFGRPLRHDQFHHRVGWCRRGAHRLQGLRVSRPTHLRRVPQTLSREAVPRMCTHRAGDVADWETLQSWWSVSADGSIHPVARLVNAWRWEGDTWLVQSGLGRLTKRVSTESLAR